MKRRELIGLIGCAAAWPLAARAQGRAYRVGTLTAGPSLLPSTPRGAILLNALAKRGYQSGRNLSYEARGSFGKNELLPGLMNELKVAGVEVVITIGFPAAVTAKYSGLPTVLASGTGDPVATALVQSLARPGSNVTGIADDASALSTKRLSLLKSALPKIGRVAMLWNKGDLAMSQRYSAAAKAAQALGIEVQALGVSEPNDLAEAFDAMKREMPDAILMLSDSLTLLNRKRIVDFAAENKLPAIYETDNIVHEGGLMSYGADDGESLERVAAMVDLILKGARPGDLPVEQPTRFRFMINLKTARSIGLDMPATLTALADEIIE